MVANYLLNGMILQVDVDANIPVVMLTYSWIPLQSLTWPLKNDGWKATFFFGRSLSIVKLRGCTWAQGQIWRLNKSVGMAECPSENLCSGLSTGAPIRKGQMFALYMQLAGS